MPARVNVRRTTGSVGGIYGLHVQFVGSKEAEQAMQLLPKAIQRRVLRGAVAAGARPILRLAKTYAKAASMRSHRREGIGTTARAMDSKVQTSKRNPAIAYGIIGVRRGYDEIVALDKNNAVSGIRLRRNAKRPYTRTGRFQLQIRKLKNLGPIARKARLNPKSNSARKRAPSRYLHIIDKGTRRSLAHEILIRAGKAGRGAMQVAFENKLDEGIGREVERIRQKATVK